MQNWRLLLWLLLLFLYFMGNFLTFFWRIYCMPETEMNFELIKNDKILTFLKWKIIIITKPRTFSWLGWLFDADFLWNSWDIQMRLMQWSDWPHVFTNFFNENYVIFVLIFSTEKNWEQNGYPNKTAFLDQNLFSFSAAQNWWKKFVIFGIRIGC